MTQLKNYGIAPMLALVLIAGLGIMIPIFIFGMGATIKALQFIFSPPTTGSVPIWSLFVVAIIFLFIMKRRRTNPYLV